MNLRNLKWTKLSEFVLSGMKALHVMLNFFWGVGGWRGGGRNFIHGFGLVWKEKLFEEGMRRSREVFTYPTFFSVSSSWMKIDTKTAA